MAELTIIMYHYVRPIIDSEFPGIKGLEIQQFKKQLDFLEENFSIISSEQVIDAVLKKKKLPANACWLTFDDGYKDHLKYVLPELLKRNLNGAFFPPKVSITENKLLDVNSIHHILSRASDKQILVKKLNKNCQLQGISEEKLNSYYQEFARSNRWDTAEIIYIKRMLQHVLPESVRNSITSTLFEEYVGVSEGEFSSKLYMNVEEVRELVRNGMHVGSHGSMHYWLDKISAKKQKEDIVESLGFLEEIGASTKKWIMCYPYGAYNKKTISLLKKLGASVGVTTQVRKAIIGKDNPLTLPRFDTNDFL